MQIFAPQRSDSAFRSFREKITLFGGWKRSFAWNDSSWSSDWTIGWSIHRCIEAFQNAHLMEGPFIASSGQSIHMQRSIWVQHQSWPLQARFSISSAGDASSAKGTGLYTMNTSPTNVLFTANVGHDSNIFANVTEIFLSMMHLGSQYHSFYCV
jgi:hypothetical protein